MWARQKLGQGRCWLPTRQIVSVGDDSYSVLELLCAATNQHITVVTRLRLDGGLYAPPPVRSPKGSCKTGRPRVKGEKLPTLEQIAANPTTQWTTVRVPRWYTKKQAMFSAIFALVRWHL